jgi:fructose-specific phosphotransferase system IIC component
MFNKLKLGDRKSRIAVCIEPLSQADIVSANPVPIYTANFIGGALAGAVIASSGMINDATGTATPLAGFLVMFGFNDPLKIFIYGAIIAVIGLIVGYVCSKLFKNYPIVTQEDIESR